MKKLALSVVLLMVAGAGVSVSAVGCSSSSSAGTTAGGDSGTGADVTQGDDSGTGGETSTEDTGTTTTDSGTTMEAAATCDVDGGGSFVFPGADGGENTACATCISTNCAMSQCFCLADTNMVNPDDAGAIPACGGYVECLYGAAEAALPDAGLSGLSALLPGFETACGTGLPAASTDLGKAFVGCAVNSCSACIRAEAARRTAMTGPPASAGCEPGCCTTCRDHP